MTASPADGIAADAEDGVLRIVVDRPQRKGSLDPAAVRSEIRVVEHLPRTDAGKVDLSAIEALLQEG